MPVSAAIYGIAGPALTHAEAIFFRAADPWGYILFQRNCETPDQVRALTDSLRALSGREDLPVLIDEEGGRVQRLNPPHWRIRPPARPFGTLFARDPERARALARLNSHLIAHDLRRLGITVDCLPCADVPVPGAHDIIGDRSYGETVEPVAVLGRAASEGLMEGGVLPVMKHMPGHGRARVDSHVSLPVVEASRATLEATDFAAFKALSDLPLAMTGHVLFEAIDRDACATLSPIVVQDVIRGSIGFDGLLMTEDLSMHALQGGVGARADSAFNAGCDVVMHCHGTLAELEEIADRTPALAGAAKRRAEAALARLGPFAPLEDPDGTARAIAMALKDVLTA